MAVCIEDDSRSSGLCFKIFGLQKNCLCCCVSDLLLVHVAGSGNGRLPIGLKVWKTVPFLEDTLVSGTEAVTIIS
jgi:4'-phosphopantetheinyl transferase